MLRLQPKEGGCPKQGWRPGRGASSPTRLRRVSTYACLYVLLYRALLRDTCKAPLIMFLSWASLVLQKKTELVEPDELYDEGADDADEAWVAQHYRTWADGVDGLGDRWRVEAMSCCSTPNLQN